MGFDQPLLPNKLSGRARVSDRRVLNGTFYMLRMGSSWGLYAERREWHLTASGSI